MLWLDYFNNETFYKDCFKVFPIMLALCLMLSTTYHARNHAGIIGLALTTRITSLTIRDRLLCFYYYPLCYAAVLLKFTNYAQEQEFLSDYYAYLYAI